MTPSRSRAVLWFSIALAATLGGLGLTITGPLAAATAQNAERAVGSDSAASTTAASKTAALTTAASTSGPTKPGVKLDPSAVTLLGQSAWVSDRHDYHLHLGVAATVPADEQLEVMVYSPLTTRTGFDEAMSGQVHGYAMYSVRQPVSALPRDPAGGVDIDIPVNEASTGRIPSLYTSAGSAVFPVQVGLVDNSGAGEGAPVSTFLVYGEPPSVSGLPKLSVSLVLPIHAAPPVGDNGRIGALPASQSVQLADLVDALAAYPGIKLTLAITPETLEALGTPSASRLDGTTLATLVNLVHAGRVEVLPGTYAEVPLQGWDAAGLSAELQDQLATGSSVLARFFGAGPSATTWVINGSLDSPALQTLEASGAKQFILPDAELSALPVVAQETTFAFPAHLVGPGARAAVYGADAGLTADFSNPGGAALAASRLLAEMAMIQLETPGLTRGVAVLPPAGWSENANFVRTLLAGLQGHPLLNPVTASGVFSAVPVSPVQRSLLAHPTSGAADSSGQETAGPAGSSATGTPATGTPATGTPATGTPATGILKVGTAGAGAATTSGDGTPSTAPAQSAPTFGFGSTRSITTVASGATGDIGTELGPDVPAILAARRGLAGMVAVLPQEAQRVVALRKELLTSESTDLTELQRQGLLTQIQAAITKVTSLITLPRSTSITLTSTRGSIPLTVLSTSSVHARVELRLSSERLIFQRFSTSNGRCTVPTSTSEVCDLTLTTHNTTLKVPVETRTSGVFPRQVSLWTPDGSELIAQTRDTVRSTAVSGVGVVLILLAVVSLGIWWIRDLRHGRRARRLVPAPPDDPPSPDELAAECSEDAPDVAVASRVGAAAGPVDVGGSPEPADLPDPETMVRHFFSVPAAEHNDQTSGRLS